MEPASQFCRKLQYQERPLSIFVRHQPTKGSFSQNSYGFRVLTLSSEFLENAKKCLVKISSQKFSSERSLLFYSILNFIITDCCSRSITRILFSSFQRIGILLSNYYFSPFLTNINPKTNQVQTITVMVQKNLHVKVLHCYVKALGHNDISPFIFRSQIFELIKDSTIESVSIILLEVLNPDVGQPTDVHLEDLKRESERICSKYPFGQTISKIIQSKLLAKQIYYTILNDIIIMLFPEFGKRM